MTATPDQPPASFPAQAGHDLFVATKFAPSRAAFDQAAIAGFRAAEFWLNESILDRHEEIAGTAAHFPMRYALHFPTTSRLRPESLEHCVRLYEAVNARALILHEPQYLAFHAELTRLLPSIRFAVENHHLRPADFLPWCARQPGITLDVEHLWMLCLGDVSLDRLLAEVEAFLDRFGDRLQHVHLPGYTPGYDEHRPMYCNRDLVFAIWDRLAARRFDGLIVSEVANEFQNPCDLRMDALLYDRWKHLRLGPQPASA